MKYGFIAMVEDQEIVSYETQHQVAADALLGALGLDIMISDRAAGDVDTYLFTDAELSAAEEALTLHAGLLPPEEILAGIAYAQVFLHDVREWMQKEADSHEDRDIFDIEVEIGFF